MSKTPTVSIAYNIKTDGTKIKVNGRIVWDAEYISYPEAIEAVARALGAEIK